MKNIYLIGIILVGLVVIAIIAYKVTTAHEDQIALERQYIDEIEFEAPCVGNEKEEQKTLETSNEPHYYISTLREFFIDADGFKTAVFADLDDDGIDELVAVKQIALSQGIIAQFAVIDIKKERIVSDLIGHQGFGEGLCSSPTFYLSENNYLIVAPVPTEWYWETIFQYKDGELTKYVLYDDWYDGFQHNGEEITEDQFSDYSKQYGSGIVKKLLWIGFGEDLGHNIDKDDVLDEIINYTEN